MMFFELSWTSKTRWTSELSQREFIKVLQSPADQQFQGLVDLYDDALKRLSERELGPNIIICSLPDDLLTQFHTWQPKGGSNRSRRRRRPQNNRLQLMLFTEQDEDDDNADNLALVRNFRRSLKARAMEHKTPIQLAHNSSSWTKMAATTRRPKRGMYAPAASIKLAASLGASPMEARTPALSVSVSTTSEKKKTTSSIPVAPRHSLRKTKGSCYGVTTSIGPTKVTENRI